ncbi:MAG: TetR/AcrR family transcriptional regulator [Bacillota bacterium]
MEGNRNTDDLILSAFLRLTAERGLDGVTTREIAQEAGVNPVTLFRRFGDKATIAVEAIRRYSPVARLENQTPAVDLGNAAEDLVLYLLYLAEATLEHRRVPWLRLAMMEVSGLPEVQAELRAIVQAVYGYLRRLLAQAAPALRPEVDHHVTALQWMGLMRTATQMGELLGEAELSLEDWRNLLRAAVRPLVREV